jgi:polyhydroxyalkanoate synthesis regulator protein
MKKIVYLSLILTFQFSLSAHADIYTKGVGLNGMGTSETWVSGKKQRMVVTSPMMQGMMSNYIEQSKSLFIQMQEQMQSQTKNMFGTFPFVPPTVDKPQK